MNVSDHCLICDNSKQSVSYGIICDITDKKADFVGECTKSKFNKKLIERIERIEFDYWLIKDKKLLTILNVIFFLTLSAVLISSGYYLWMYIYTKGLVSIIPVILFFIGITVLPQAIGPLRKFLSDKRINDDKFKRLVEVLKIYDIDFQSTINVRKQKHNILSVSVKINLITKSRSNLEYVNTFDYNNNEKRIEDYHFGKTISGGTDVISFS